MGNGEKDNAVVVFAEAKVEGPGALVMGRPERGDGEAERGCERLAKLGDVVDDGVEGEELWASRVGYLGLAKRDLNLGEAGLAEDPLDGVGGSDRIFEEESLGLHADPYEERTERCRLPGVCEGDRVDRCSLDAARVEELVNVRTDLKPRACAVMVTVDRAGLTEVTPGLSTTSFRPGRARLVNAGCPAGHTIEVPYKPQGSGQQDGMN